MKNLTRTVVALALLLGASTVIAVVLDCPDRSQAQPGVPVRAPAEHTGADAGSDTQAVKELGSDLPSEEEWSDDVHRLARLATNEDGLTARRSERDPRHIDIYLIAAVQLQRAVAENATVAEVIARHHPRHTRPGRTNGAWVPGLSKTMDRPAEWPDRAIPWETSWRGRAAWEARLREARDILASGNAALSCPAALPVGWRGPVTDYENLVSRLASGRFRIVAGPTIRNEQPEWRVPEEQCSVGTRSRSSNVFIARSRDLDRGAAR